MQSGYLVLLADYHLSHLTGVEREPNEKQCYDPKELITLYTVTVLLAMIQVCCPLLLSPNKSACNSLHITSLQQMHNSYRLGKKKTWKYFMHQCKYYLCTRGRLLCRHPWFLSYIFTNHKLSLEFTFEAFNERSLVWRALCCMELENPGTYRVNVYEIHKDFICMRKSEWKQFKHC